MDEFVCKYLKNLKLIFNLLFEEHFYLWCFAQFGTIHTI